jgi:hypothetical protein
VARGGARLNLRLTHGPVFAPEFRSREVDAVCATITVEHVEQLYETLRLAGAGLHQPLTRQPWGARTFIVRDPDDNLILFAGR